MPHIVALVLKSKIPSVEDNRMYLEGSKKSTIRVDKLLSHAILFFAIIIYGSKKQGYFKNVLDYV